LGSVRWGDDLGAIRADRLASQAAAKRLAGYEQFRGGIFRILRRPRLRPSRFAKVWAFCAKLLAMQRASL
jgi:hypothetical protein